MKLTITTNQGTVVDVLEDVTHNDVMSTISPDLMSFLANGLKRGDKMETDEEFVKYDKHLDFHIDFVVTDEVDDGHD